MSGDDVPMQPPTTAWQGRSVDDAAGGVHTPQPPPLRPIAAVVSSANTGESMEAAPPPSDEQEYSLSRTVSNVAQRVTTTAVEVEHMVEDAAAEVLHAVVDDAYFSVAESPEPNQTKRIDDSEAETPLSYKDSAKMVFRLSVPSMVRMGFLFIAQNISLMFVGNYLNADEMSGISAGLTFLWMVGIFPSMGIACAVDTLCAQEYGRDKRSTALGVYARRGIVVNALYALPITILCLNSGSLLATMFDANMAQLAGVWLRFSILYLFPQGCMIILSKFCETQCLPGVPMKSQLVATLTTPLWSALLIPSYRLYGACLTLGLVSLVQVAVAFFLIFRSEQLRHTWGWGDTGITWKAVKDDLLRSVLTADGMGHYLKLAVPSMLFLGMEGAAFNGTAMLAAYLGPTQCAAWTILLQLQAFGWSSTYGCSTGVAVRIGNSLGENRPLQARKYAITSVGLAVLASSCNSIVFLAFRDAIESLFTNDAAITAQMNTIAVMLPIMHISDCTQFVFQGIYAGAGQNHIGAPILLCFLWLLGLPLSALLAVGKGLGIRGILLGMSTAMIIEIPVYVFIMNRFDWPELARRAAGMEKSAAGAATAASSAVAVVVEGSPVVVETPSSTVALTQQPKFSIA